MLGCGETSGDSDFDHSTEHQKSHPEHHVQVCKQRALDKSYCQAHVILFTILVCQTYSIQYPFFLLQIAVKFLCGGIVKFVQIRSKASWNKIISTLRQIFLPKNKTSKTESRRNKNQPTLKIFYVKLNLHFVELSYLFIQSNLIILLISHQLKLF